MVRYPATLEPDDNNTFLVSFPDFPEAHTFGETEREALERARDALATAIDACISDRQPLPEPSMIRSARWVSLPALMSAKVDLYRMMLKARLSKADLGRRLGLHPPQIDRLLDLRHGTRVEQLEAAAAALGASLEMHLTPVVPLAVFAPTRGRAQARVSTVRRPQQLAGVAQRVAATARKKR